MRRDIDGESAEGVEEGDNIVMGFEFFIADFRILMALKEFLVLDIYFSWCRGICDTLRLMAFNISSCASIALLMKVERDFR